MAIKFLNTTGVENFFVADADADRVGIGTTAPKQLLHVMKGGLTPSFTAPESEVLRVQSKAPSELSGEPVASDINIFTDTGGYSRVIFTDTAVAYGENGVIMDFAASPPTLNLRTKANNTLICDYNASVYCGTNHTLTSVLSTFAAGNGNNPSGESSFAAGHLTEATGDISAAFGYDTLASGGASFSIGALTTASGGNSFASGGGSTASGGESAAFGYQTTASGEESFAIGNGTTASGASSFAGGGPTTLASAPNAFAFGADVDVTGGHSAAFGRLHDVAGTENLVGGVSNVVNGDGNLVGGASNNLNDKNNNLVAGGSHEITSAASDYNTIIGFNNEIGFGNYNFSGGQETYNFGTRSISFGSGTTASKGDQQFAFGEGTTTPTTATAARASNQFVVGKFNDINTGCLFAVGNGTNDSSRSTALAVSTGGQVGIGTVQPVYRLHVAGGSDAAVKVERTTSGSEGQLTMLAGSTSNLIQSKGSGNNPKQLNFGIGVGTVMSLDTSGNVGIGDPSPSEKLEVNGSIKASASTDAYKGYMKSFQAGGFYHSSSSSSSTVYWIPTNYISETTSSQYYNNWVAPYAGRIKTIYMRYASGTTPTATSVTFRYAVNGSTSAATFPATVTSGASTSMIVKGAFGNTDIVFSAGDRLQLGFTTNGGTRLLYGFSYTIVFEYNIT